MVRLAILDRPDTVRVMSTEGSGHAPPLSKVRVHGRFSAPFFSWTSFVVDPLGESRPINIGLMQS